jgi:hypothetical protein
MKRTFQYADLESILARTQLNEKRYLEQLKGMPLVSADDVINYLNHGTWPKGYTPRNIKLFMPVKKLETDRVRDLLNSGDKEMRTLGMIMISAHVKDYYPQNSELMEGNRERMNEKDFIKYCMSQLSEIAYLEGERVGDDPLDNIKNTIKGIKSGMGGGWG